MILHLLSLATCFKLQTYDNQFFVTTNNKDVGTNLTKKYSEGSDYGIQDEGSFLLITTKNGKTLDIPYTINIYESGMHKKYNQQFAIEETGDKDFINIIYKGDGSKKCFTSEGGKIVLRSCNGGSTQKIRKAFEDPALKKEEPKETAPEKAEDDLKIREEELIRREEELQRFKDEELAKKEHRLDEDIKIHSKNNWCDCYGCKECDKTQPGYYKQYKNPFGIVNE